MGYESMHSNFYAQNIYSILQNSFTFCGWNIFEKGRAIFQAVGRGRLTVDIRVQFQICGGQSGFYFDYLGFTQPLPFH